MACGLMLMRRACDVEPYAYPLRVLAELPQPALNANVSDLLPFNYAKQRAQVGAG